MYVLLEQALTLAHLVAGPLRVRDLVLDEDEVLDRGRLLQNVLKLGQELVRGDDVGDLGLGGNSIDHVLAMFRRFFELSAYACTGIG